jgi:hypothetical protein
MITLELTFKNAISGKSRRFSLPEPVSTIASLTTELDSHMTTYVEPILPNSLLFASARLIDRETTDLIEK